MKDSGNSAAVGRAPERAAEQVTEREEFVSRKLIRPALSTQQHRTDNGDRLTSAEQRVPRRSNAPEQTHAETFYFQKQMQSRTPMVVVLKDGEELHGWIEWYDRSSIKLNRSGASNLLLYKSHIKYMFKAGENGRR
jgi:host factor-I protein